MGDSGVRTLSTTAGQILPPQGGVTRVVVLVNAGTIDTYYGFNPGVTSDNGIHHVHGTTLDVNLDANQPLWGISASSTQDVSWSWAGAGKVGPTGPTGPAGPASSNATQLQGFDVTDATPTDTQVLTWVDADSLWEPQTLSDVDHSIPAGGIQGEVLTKLDSADYNVDWVRPWQAAGETSAFDADYGFMYFCDASGADFAATLPAPTLNGAQVIVKNVGPSGKVTVLPNGGESIDNGTTFPITTRYASFTFIADGSNWWVI